MISKIRQPYDETNGRTMSGMVTGMALYGYQLQKRAVAKSQKAGNTPFFCVLYSVLKATPA
jgi:hypothetical protein